MLTKQVRQKSVVFVTIGIFLNKGFRFKPYVCNRYHDLLMMSMNSMNLCNIAILKIGNTYYRFVITGISKSEAIKLLYNIDLTEKSRTL